MQICQFENDRFLQHDVGLEIEVFVVCTSVFFFLSAHVDPN